jgi:membrane protein DedA with SNARE-associated domain
VIEWLGGLGQYITLSLVEGNLLVLGILSLITTAIEFGIQVPWVQDSVLLMIGYQPPDRILILAPLVMTALTFGRILGASILYWSVRVSGPRFTGWLEGKFPKIMTKVQEVNVMVEKKAWLAVALARYTPGLLIPTSVASGLFRVRYTHFCTGIIISSVIPDCGEILYGLAVKTGFTVMGIPPSPALFIITLIILMVFIWLGNWLWITRKSRRRLSSKTPIL